MIDRRKFLQASSAFMSAAVLPRFAVADSSNGVIELVAEEGTAEFYNKKLYGKKGKPSKMWLYNGKLPGPAITAKKGERVKVRFTNRLPDPTSIHWHGIRIANQMDGVANLTQEPVGTGESFDYDFVVPDAGTFWYHAHNMSWNQVPRGLSGPLIIQEKQNQFGPDEDITLVLSDWVLNTQGQLETAGLGSMRDFSHAGRLGNWLTVNGQDLPDIPLKAGKWHRLRIINTSSARILPIAPERFGGRVIGYDGQMFEAPREISGNIDIAPSQRVDLVVKPEKQGRIAFEIMTGTPFKFAEFVVGPGDLPDDDFTMPEPNNLPEPDLGNATILPLKIEGGAMGGNPSLVHQGQTMGRMTMMRSKQFWGLNGIAGMSKEPMFRAKIGQTIVLDSVNDTAWPHAMHIHGHHFRLLERDGNRLENQDWRDTFLTQRNERVKIGFVADNPGKWLIHCHMLGHAASGMTNWFEVV